MKLYTIIIATLALVLTASCSSDEPEISLGEVEYCMKAAWHNGRGTGSRALSSLLEDAGGSALELLPEEYPEEITLSCNGKDFNLLKSSALVECANHSGFFNGYSSEYPLKDIEAKKGVTASAILDGGDELFSEKEDVELDGVHLKITMHHSKALLRFGFKVADKYYRIRNILVTGIKLNDVDCPLAHKVLTTSGQFIAYVYVDPAMMTTTTPNTIVCTYNIYDKDATFDTVDGIVTSESITDNAVHLTRKDVKARNHFTLGSLKDAGGNPVTSIKASYYYDLNVILNPDYLYVLSEHDNKHITIE